ncbi:choline/ethanolamine kinase [Parasteatoda tepidariorum]|uniref:choline/ethanolamine kinase n=1 Tax=Parasteatoda tepidariorum TaxID=114398 RepID=UPI001C726F73|nr:choline/ethanolamine kinase [Parasteatoda tepidariorum]
MTTASENEKNIKEEAFKLCKDFLGTPWNEISLADFNISSVRGGISNALYCCSLPSHVVVKNPGTPRRVLLRFFGPVQDEEHTKVTETTTFVLLSERKLGPKLYGAFSNGRLEEYIPAKHLSTDDVRRLSTSVAKAMAKIHALDLPLRKAPDSWLKHMKKWLEDMENCGTNRSDDNCLLGNMFRNEMDFLKKEMENYDSPSVFCHNDLIGGNILLPEDFVNELNPKVILIDFEFGGYNFRAFDIANHFCEWVYDYDVTEPPYFKIDNSKYPTEEEKIKFIRSYLNQLVLEDILKSSVVDYETDKILDEVKFFSMVTRLYWALWSEKNKYDANIGVFHKENSKARLKQYWKFKEQYLEEKSSELSKDNSNFVSNINESTVSDRH